MSFLNGLHLQKQIPSNFREAEAGEDFRTLENVAGEEVCAVGFAPLFLINPLT
jgi:hypothetical protein